MENQNLVSEAFKVIRKHEGFKAEPYLDSKNNWTVGIGTLIGKGKDADLKASPYYGKKINEATAQKIAVADINKKIDLVKGLIGPDKFDTFSPQLQAQIVSGAYRGDITGSPKTLSLLREGKFKEASKEFLDNEEYRTAKASKSGVAGRMEEVSSVMAVEKQNSAVAKPNFADVVEYRLLQNKILPERK
jgi:GH24 family phage-related lysozyme (muramidase)